LLGLVTVTIQGCHWGDRHSKAEEIPALHGISVMEFDGLNLRVKRGSDASGLALLVAGREVEQVELRVGDRFSLSDGQNVHETYQLLMVSDERITLKRQKIYDHRATREGVRTVESVIALTPYDLENTD
jgi:hypothetical protein